MSFTFGSVCSGIEAASVAWHPLGWRAAWLAEIEPFPSAVLAHHYPEVPNLGDMTELPERVVMGEIEAPDLFCGGTPCQAFSVAGLRKSLDDARGNLSLTFCEIANAIDISRAHDGLDPCIVFWENVPGVLNTKDNAFGCFLAGLAGEDDALVAPGGKWPNAGAVFGPQRAVAWRVLDAQYFGLAQRRRRVFVVASARDGFDPAAVLFEFDGLRRDTAPSREAREGTAARAGSGTAGRSWPADIAGCLNAAFGEKQGLEDQHINSGAPWFVPGPTHSLRGEGFDASEDGTGRCTPLVPMGVTIHGTDKTQKVASYTDLVGSLRANTPGRIENSSTTVVQQPVIAFHENQRAEVTLNDTTGGQMAVVAEYYSHDYCHDRVYSADGISPALNCSQDHSIRTAMQVRRLTPRECERLQGFFDDYTLVPYRGKPAADGPRYKALGNSWAVPNVRWIGWRIAAQVFGDLA